MTETIQARRGSVDPGEVGKFDRMARHWWDPDGEMAALHRLNPLRIGYIRDTLLSHFERTPDDPLRPLAGLRLLDVGCGGGILAEPLARLGAEVTGIDAARETVKAARNHAELQGLRIDYRAAGVEDLAAGAERFDAVLAMEIVEHVSDVDGFLAACGDLVRPGGLAFVATLNRTPKSFLLAKVGAEYVLGWLPRGTHDWRRFVRPSEAARGLRAAGLTVAQVTGVSYDPLRAAWALSSDTDVNYMLVAEKPA
jgi:2-polyprenyl-6-hydroxyphenyl methylase/3-demethylubiquinone-9 3-methyltransferase